jgi:hypothetical protein
MADAAYHFLSYVRSGFAASIVQPDTFGAGQSSLATANVGVNVSGVAAPVSHQVTVRGPGDVIGIAQTQIVRTDPIDGAVGVEPNYFAQVEFDRPDLPWLFTPAAAAGERLRPWIVLVVVDLDGPNRCTFGPASPLPRLVVPTAAATQLPDLKDSHLWAHTQVVTPDGQTIAAALDGDPRLSVSRLMCPRHLQPNTSYLAAVVPAFEVGRLAGIGQPVPAEVEAQLAPAWVSGSETLLPVFYSFRFRTGEDADFESLARKLHGEPLPEGVGTRALDVSRPGAGLPALPPPDDVHDSRSIAWLDGALRPIDSDALPARDAATEQAFRGSLTILLDRPATLVRGGDADPVVAPPIYGDHHALVVELGAGSPPPWISELNLDARTRVAAGLGTQVVQARQEDLVNRAWRQLGEVLAANHLLRRAQFARTASARVHQRLAALDDATFVAVTAPLHARVTGVTGGNVSLARALRDSRVPDVAAAPAFRRLVRPSGAIARAAGVASLSRDVVTRFSSEIFAAPVGTPDGVAAMRPASEVIGSARATVVLAAVNDAAPDQSSRLDTVLQTLGSNMAALPSGDTVRAAPPRNDLGGVSILTGLGAVTASAVSAALEAAVPVASPPPPPPPAHGGLPPIHEIPPIHIVPHGVFQQVGSVPVSVFLPPGKTIVLDPGKVTFDRGKVVITEAPIRGIADGTIKIQQVSDTQWTQVVSQHKLPAPSQTADPVADPGSRLDAFRRDPAAMTALADVATGQLQGVLVLDQVAGNLATTTAGAAAFGELAQGTFATTEPVLTGSVGGAADLALGRSLVGAAAGALDRMVGVSDAPPRPAGPVIDLGAVRQTLVARVDPELTVAARVHERISSLAQLGVLPRDDLDPVMACPVFLDSMWEGVHALGDEWLLPGLELVPPDTATLVRTNPSFVAAHMVGLNHEFMRELLWREYPTDQRGTSFKRFWGRTGPQPDDIGPVHQFGGDLTDNLVTRGASEAVLLLRSELLRRYPGSIVYVCRAVQQGANLVLDDSTIVLPVFRGDLRPDVTFIGFPLTPDELRSAGEPWWFVIAQPPAEPRFGLDDPTADTPGTPTSANDLAWSHMAPDGNPATLAPFAIGDPPALHGHSLDGGLVWGTNAAVQAHLTYQHPVRVAIRALDMLPPP